MKASSYQLMCCCCHYVQHSIHSGFIEHHHNIIYYDCQYEHSFFFLLLFQCASIDATHIHIFTIFSYLCFLFLVFFFLLLLILVYCFHQNRFFKKIFNIKKEAKCLFLCAVISQTKWWVYCTEEKNMEDKNNIEIFMVYFLFYIKVYESSITRTKKQFIQSVRNLYLVA